MKMEDTTSKTDLSEWSQDDKNELLNNILLVAGNSKKSYKAVEASIKWEAIKLSGKSAEECKAMYQRLISKVRKYRTAQEIISDALSLTTDGHIKEELPDLPKKPVTAFSLFVQKRSKKFPDLKGMNRMKVFASDWNELPEEKKEVYRKKYMKLKKKYEEELEIFRHNHPEYQSSSTATSTRPQPPVPSKLYVESRLEKFKIKQPELSNAEAVKKLMTKYKNLSDKKKLKWINRAKDCEQKYLDECETYLAHNPNSSTKPGVFHLSKDEQRIWHSSRGKPMSAPPKNLFMYFCNCKRNALLHLSISEQSKELAAIYHKLTEDELKDLKENFKQELEKYVTSYRQYYQSLSEEEKSHEKSPEVALDVYQNILQKGQKKKKKKKQQKTENSAEADQKKVKLSDLLPRPDSNADISQSDSDDSPQEEVVTSNKKRSHLHEDPHKRKSHLHEDPIGPHKRKSHLHEDPVVPHKRKSHLHEDPVVPHKRKSQLHEDRVVPHNQIKKELGSVSPPPNEKTNHFDIATPSTKSSANSGDDALLSFWSPLKPNVSLSGEDISSSQGHNTTKSKTPKKSRKSK